MTKLEVILVDTNKVSIDYLLSSSFLSNKDKEQLSKYKVEETKKEKVVSLILKNKYIKEYHINEFGKPLSNKTCFNISHSKGMVALVIDNVPIGIDIEKIRPANDKLIDYISSNEEKEYIKNETNFYEIWTNKESLVKAIGSGIKEKVKTIPSLPINGKKPYKNKIFYSVTKEHLGFVVSINRESSEPFEIEFKEEKL